MAVKAKPILAIVALSGLGLAVATFAHVSRGQAPPDLRAAIELCAACHGRVGRAVAPGVPHLAGQNLEYLLNQLQRFARRPRSDFIGDAIVPPLAGEISRTHQRRSDTMAHPASALPGDTLRAVAQYYSRLPCVQADRPAQSEAAPGGIAWCADCHAPHKARASPSIPFIYGQDAAYLEAQLLAFKRSGSFQTQSGVSAPGPDERSHPTMDLFLRDIPDARIAEIAQHYSRLYCSAK